MGLLLQAEDGIRDLVRSRGLGDVYKRQVHDHRPGQPFGAEQHDCRDRAARELDHRGRGAHALPLIHI